MDEGKGQFGCLANINTGPQVISREDNNSSSLVGVKVQSHVHVLAFVSLADALCF